MLKIVFLIATLLLLELNRADAANVGVDLNLQIGDPPPQQVIIRESAPHDRVIVIEPEPAYDSFSIDDDVEFIYPSRLGFYVGVGVPYDLFFLNNFYFTYRDGYWYRAHNHRGPWVEVEHRHLPPGLRKHKLDRIRHYRDNEYRVYERERNHYQGRYVKSYRGEWKEHRKNEKNHYREERRIEKEHWKEGKQGENNGHGRNKEKGRHGRD